ncbi:regulator of chromosome condensation 1/beta-lactamase-inhibitor protein II [Aspergillus californicus]
MPSTSVATGRKRSPTTVPKQTNGASTGSKRKAKAIPGAARSHKRQGAPPNLNNPPTKRLDVYVFGTNCDGELGVGGKSEKTEIPRPVLNPNLAADTVGVVHLAVGGVHSAALTHDNQILTWGVNDEGALGRDTKPDTTIGPSSGGEYDEVGAARMNEATPKPVDPLCFPRDTVFTQLAATGSATFALTATGSVYGWGTFRGNSGEIGFSPRSKGQERTPVIVPNLDHVVKISAGAQHMLALTSSGTVLSWGCDEQSQLGRRRTHHGGSHHLIPGECALPSGIVDIGTGEYHSFAIHKTGAVYGWGSNNYGQTAIFANAGTSDAITVYPSKVQSLKQFPRITSIQGGKDHSLAITEAGQCLSWGRIENKALGIDEKDIPPSDTIIDANGRPRILKVPMVLDGIHDAVGLGLGTDHSFVITRDGRAYSWGFGIQGQTGQPGDAEEVVHPTLLSNKHVDGKRLVFAAAGGQFSIVAGEHEAK